MYIIIYQQNNFKIIILSKLNTILIRKADTDVGSTGVERIVLYFN